MGLARGQVWARPQFTTDRGGRLNGAAHFRKGETGLRRKMRPGTNRYSACRSGRSGQRAKYGRRHMTMLKLAMPLIGACVLAVPGALAGPQEDVAAATAKWEIGRASCRERVEVWVVTG